MVTRRGISTAVDTVLAVSLVAAAVTALVVLAPSPTTAPPDAGVALDALAVSTATVNASDGPVRATLATHLAAPPARPTAGTPAGSRRRSNANSAGSLGGRTWSCSTTGVARSPSARLHPVPPTPTPPRSRSPPSREATDR